LARMARRFESGSPSLRGVDVRRECRLERTGREIREARSARVPQDRA
jgi:hypothetical protein